MQALKWECTCATCPFFRLLETTKSLGEPALGGACFGHPDGVGLMPTQLSPAEMLSVGGQLNGRPMKLVPATLPRTVPSDRLACSLHPEYNVYVVQYMQWRQAGSQGNA